MVFGANATHKARDEAALGDVVNHGELFGHGHRVVQQRQGPTQNRDLDILGATRQRTGHDAGLRHQSIGVLVVLVDAHAVKAELVCVFELVKVAVVELGAFFRIVVAVGQRDPGRVVGLVVVQVQIRIGHQVHHVELHQAASWVN